MSADMSQNGAEWYVIHTYSGYENKVKANLERRVKTMEKEDKILFSYPEYVSITYHSAPFWLVSALIPFTRLP